MGLESLQFWRQLFKKVLFIRWKFSCVHGCLCCSVEGWGASSAQQSLQGLFAFWSDLSHGKQELQLIPELLCQGLLLNQGDLSHIHVLIWDVSEWGSCHCSERAKNGLEYGLSVLHVVIWSMRISVQAGESLSEKVQLVTLLALVRRRNLGKQ